MHIMNDRVESFIIQDICPSIDSIEICMTSNINIGSNIDYTLNLNSTLEVC